MRELELEQERLAKKADESDEAGDSDGAKVTTAVLVRLEVVVGQAQNYRILTTLKIALIPTCVGLNVMLNYRVGQQKNGQSILSAF